MKTAEYFYVGFFTLALVLLYFAYREYNKTVYLLSTGTKTKGTAVDLITVNKSNGISYKPVFEYIHKNGETRIYKSNVSSYPSAYNIGDEVTIIYSTDTDDLRIISYWGLYRWTVILLCFAASLLIISGGYFLYIRG